MSKVYRITEKYGLHYVEVEKSFLGIKYWSRVQEREYGRWVDREFRSLELAKSHVKDLLYKDAPAVVVWVSNLDSEAEKALLNE